MASKDEDDHEHDPDATHSEYNKRLPKDDKATNIRRKSSRTSIPTNFLGDYATHKELGKAIKQKIVEDNIKDRLQEEGAIKKLEPKSVKPKSDEPEYMDEPYSSNRDPLLWFEYFIEHSPYVKQIDPKKIDKIRQRLTLHNHPDSYAFLTIFILALYPEEPENLDEYQPFQYNSSDDGSNRECLLDGLLLLFRFICSKSERYTLDYPLLVYRTILYRILAGYIIKYMNQTRFRWHTHGDQEMWTALKECALQVTQKYAYLLRKTGKQVETTEFVSSDIIGSNGFDKWIINHRSVDGNFYLRSFAPIYDRFQTEHQIMLNTMERVTDKIDEEEYRKMAKEWLIGLTILKNPKSVTGRTETEVCHKCGKEKKPV